MRSRRMFRLGLEKLHNLTYSGSYGLQIVLKMNNGGDRVVEYEVFRVTGEQDKYRLFINRFKAGNSGLADRFSYHNGSPFSTFDRDNDNWSKNCAKEYAGGWWFKDCYHSHLNNVNGPAWIQWNQYEQESTMILKKITN